MRVLILLIFFAPAVVFSQFSIDSAKSFHERGTNFEKSQQWDSARDSYSKAAHIYLKQGYMLQFLDEQYQAASTYLSAKEFSKADSAFSGMIGQYESEIKKNGLGIVYFDRLSQAVGRQQRYFEAYKIALKSYALLSENTPLKLKREVVSGLSSLSRLLGFYNEGLKYAYEYLDYSEDPFNKSQALNSVGLIHKRLKNKKEAIAYYTKCLALREKHAPAWIPYVLNNMADLYNNFGPYDSALYWSNQGLHYVDSLMGKYNYAQLKGVLLISKSLALEEAEDVQSARKALLEAHAIFSRASPKYYHQIDVVNSAIRLGMVEFAKRQLDMYSSDELKGSRALDFNVSKGNCFLKAGALDSSLFYLNAAINLFHNDPALNDPNLPASESLLLQEALLKKLIVLTELYDETKNVKYLEEVIEENDYLLREIAVDRYEHINLASSSTFFDQKKQYLDILIEVASKLYTYSNERKYLDNISRIMEVKRLNSFKKDFAFEQSKIAGIPDSILLARRNLQAQIHELRSKSGDGDELLKLQRELEGVHLYIKQANKNFSKTISADIKDLVTIESSLKSEESLIQFSFSEETLYILVSERTGSRLIYIPWGPEQEQIVTALIESLKKPDTNIEGLSNALLHTLEWERLEIKPGTLRILADKRLSLIPFSTLKRNGSYLIQDFNFIYMNSLVEFDRATSSGNGTLLSFAPFTDNAKVAEVRTANLINNLGSLPGSQNEVDNISLLWSGQAFKGEDATEFAFKEHAPNAEIIHLATHSLIDNENPMNSVIVFSENKGKEDGLLHTYELLNMRLNANLVTLSACNTGVGTYYEGEGMISLATGFNISGVDNIIMSLWPVPDQTTSIIMTSFYTYLQDGMAISEALRQAKLDFISNQDGNLKHPYYWAGFVISSDNWGNEKNESSLFLIVTLLIIAICIIVVVRKSTMVKK
ncbi:MAG: CHAT domain-containing protein [Bacteroidota bacterium]